MAQTHSLDLESGSSQYASTSTKTGIPTGNTSRTFEAWVKIESLGATIVMLAYGTRANYQTWTWAVGTDGKQLVDIFNEASAISNTAIQVGVWTHIAITYDGTTLTFYINGKADGTDTWTNTPNTGTTTDFYVGVNNNATQFFFDGLIKDVRIFSDVRTLTEIVADARTEDVSDANLINEWNFNNAYTDSSGNGNTLTASGSPTFSTDRPWVASTQVDGSTYLETNLVSYWTLDESSNGSGAVTRNDSHGSNNLTDNNTTASASGIIDNGADFESANSESLTIEDASQTGLDVGTSDFGVSVWVKLESLPASSCTILGKRSQGTTGNTPFDGYDVSVLSTGKARLYVRATATSNTDLVVESASTLSVGVWYHIVGSWDRDGNMNIYINGIDNGGASISVISSANLNLTEPFTVGCAKWSTGSLTLFTDGTIDETAIYSRALHYGDVLDLYNAGSGINYAVASGPTNLKSLSGNLKANIKSRSGNLIANMKSNSGNS